MSDKIILCGDFLATRASEQASNLRWLGDLLARPVLAALSPEVSLQHGFGRDFPLPGADEGAMHRWFDPKTLDPDALRAHVAARLVIGYELSRATRAALDLADIPWIDIWLHPARFASDILFAIGSSDARIRAALAEFALPEESLQAEADLIRIQTYRGFDVTPPDLIEGAWLFAGQMPRDKSVLTPGGFARLADHAGDFAALAARVPHIHYLAHPNVARRDPDLQALLARHSNVSEISHPSYALLADPRLRGVASLSSSLSVEARYFGKQGLHLLEPPFPQEGDGAYHTIHQSLAFGHFWSHVLAPLVATRTVDEAGYLTRANRQRSALSFYWSYPDIDRTEHRLRRLEHGQPGGVQAADGKTPHRAVAFDVFDTLITRNLARPEDVFRLIAPQMAQALGQMPDFPARRIAAQTAALAQAATRGRQETTLPAIYAHLSSAPEDDPRVRTLCEIEAQAEIAVSRARAKGAEAYRAAQASGARILLISDTYLSDTTIEALLHAAGYAGWDALHTSSRHGVTKRTGALFDRVLEAEGLRPDEMLHIGDNPQGDVAVPRAKGIAVRPMPGAMDLYAESARSHRASMARLAQGSLDDSRLLRRIADLGETDPRCVDADWRFGMQALGPLLIGFACHARKRAMALGLGLKPPMGPGTELVQQLMDLLFAQGADPAGAPEGALWLDPSQHPPQGLTAIRLWPVAGADSFLTDDMMHETHVALCARILAHATPAMAEGVLRLARATGPLSEPLELTPQGSSALLVEILVDPSAEQARHLAALLGEPPEALHPHWPEGAAALRQRRHAERRGPKWAPRGPYGLLGWRHALTPIVAFFIARIGASHDVDHYRDDPIGFFRRLNAPRYRRIGRLLYPSD